MGLELVVNVVAAEIELEPHVTPLPNVDLNHSESAVLALAAMV